MSNDASARLWKRLVGELLPTDETGAQNLNENWDLVKGIYTHANPKAINRKGFAKLLQAATIVNPYAALGLLKASRDYPEGFAMNGWADQLDILRASDGPLAKLNPGDVGEQAKYWQERTDIWALTSPFSLNGQEMPVFDGPQVVALPGKAAVKLGLGNLWKDVKRGVKGKGLWGKLCEEILFPQLAKSPGLYSYYANQMGSDWFLPFESVVAWYMELEEQTRGDFIVRPFSFGRRLAGYPVVTSRWEAENLLGVPGVPTPTWHNGQAILTNPERFPKPGYILLDCAGDKIRFEIDREFMDAPLFYHDVDGLGFGSRHISGANACFGAGASAR